MIWRPSTDALEVRRVAVDGIDHQVGHVFAVLVPARPIGQLRRHVLAEQAGHVLAGRRQGRVQGRRNQDLDDRFARPAVRPRVVVGALHVLQAGRDDDAAAVVLGRLLAGQAAEVRQFGQGHVHAEGAGAAAPALHAAQKIAGSAPGSTSRV
jgi:hypothetical protein